jgi:hypothetical protein
MGLFTILMMLFLCQSNSNASQDNIKTLVQKLVQQIDSIQNYQVNLKTRIFPPDASDLDSDAPSGFDPNRFAETNTVVFGESGKKMNMQIFSKSPDADVDTETKLIYDGIWLWVEVKVKKFPKMKIEKPLISAMKIYIPDVSPDPKNEPFNTIYGQTGTGIFRYSDLPGTFKELIKDYSFNDIEDLKKSREIIFSGTERPGQKKSDMKDVDKDIKDYIDQSTQFCKLWISKNTGLITAYLIGKSEDRPTMHTEIEYISVNDKLPKDIFTYIPPEGVVVRDATSSILEKMRQNNN